jgi:hypothetical protein
MNNGIWCPCSEITCNVQNVRAAGGKAVLRSGGREKVELEVPADQRPPILRAYLQRAPGARPHVPVNKDAALAEFQKVAAEFPVFRLISSETVQQIYETDRRVFNWSGRLADPSLMPYRLTVAVLMLEIETEWTPSRPLQKSSG